MNSPGLLPVSFGLAIVLLAGAIVSFVLASVIGGRFMPRRFLLAIASRVAPKWTDRNFPRDLEGGR